MRTQFLSSVVTAGLVSASTPHTRQTNCTAESVQAACTQLGSEFGELVLTPDSGNYSAERIEYWDVRSDQSPACIFLPTEASQVATALKIIHDTQTPFAVRGGGHMNFPGSNNIDNGVLLALNGIVQLDVDTSSKTIDVGPGARWADVYGALQPYGLYCVGGRLKTIGVPGLSLIGGWHYWNNKYGYVIDTVLSYDVVLGNGTRVVADNSTNRDLFWALKGGANNFGVVTNFKFQAFDQGPMSTTIQNFAEDQIQGYIKAVCDFISSTTSDIAAGAVFNIGYNLTTKEASASLWGTEQSEVSPPARFENFTALPSTLALNRIMNTTDWHNQFDTPNQIVMFSHKTMKLDADQIFQFFQIWKTCLEEIADVEGLFPSFVLNAAPASAAHVAKTNGIGNMWGLDDSENLIIFQLSTGWANEADDARVTSWSQNLITRMHEFNQLKGLANDFIYMGDAGEWQDPFAGMNQDNVARAKEIRTAYDPDGVFTLLNTGGFKLGA
ncbi:FAD-binding domain-containing protein [Thozetella sp. PMI_491]|nr:FAD-binding domain-containing protein [Thozetella sp. PMI_491]